MTTPAIAHPPATLEGWFALHQIFRIDRERAGQRNFDAMIRTAAARLSNGSTPSTRTKSKKQVSTATSTKGWSCIAKVIGSTSDIMVIHFRESLDSIGEAQGIFAR